MCQLSSPLDDARPAVPRTVSIDVRGLPRPQGSMRSHVLPNGRVSNRYPAAVYAWRAQLQQAMAELNTVAFTAAVELRLGFDLPRAATHWWPANSRREYPVLKPSAPLWPATAPDLDKLIRCIGDAATDAGLWRDDAQVCSIVAAKRYVIGPPGVRITISELP